MRGGLSSGRLRFDRKVGAYELDRIYRINKIQALTTWSVNPVHLVNPVNNRPDHSK
jgi:hypothetical protein